MASSFTAPMTGPSAEGVVSTGSVKALGQASCLGFSTHSLELQNLPVLSQLSPAPSLSLDLQPGPLVTVAEQVWLYHLHPSAEETRHRRAE